MVRFTATLWDEVPLLLRHHVSGQLDLLCSRRTSRLQVASSPVGRDLAVPI